MINRPLFKPDTESVLVRGLNAMTMACDSLTKQNHELQEEIASLTIEINRLKERVVTDSIEKE